MSLKSIISHLLFKYNISVRLTCRMNVKFTEKLTTDLRLYFPWKKQNFFITLKMPSLSHNLKFHGWLTVLLYGKLCEQFEWIWVVVTTHHVIATTCYSQLTFHCLCSVTSGLERPSKIWQVNEVKLFLVPIDLRLRTRLESSQLLLFKHWVWPYEEYSPSSQRQRCAPSRFYRLTGYRDSQALPFDYVKSMSEFLNFCLQHQGSGDEHGRDWISSNVIFYKPVEPMQIKTF